MLQRTLIVAAMAAQLTGCAWLFQDKLPSGYDGYSGRAEPGCSTGGGWAVVDGLFAALNAVTTLAFASDETVPNRDAYIVSGVAWTLVHTASAISGSRWASECERAHADWNRGASRRDADDERERLRLRRKLARAERPRFQSPPEPPPSPPRGFFCAMSPSSPSAATCARERADCERGRSLAIGAVPDLASCALVEVAYCFVPHEGADFQCAPTEDGCRGQQAVASTSANEPHEVSACEPRR